MKTRFLPLLLILIANLTFAQSDTILPDSKIKDRYVLWFVPSVAKNIYGIAIGPFGSEAICNRLYNYTKYSHGLNIQIPGQGFLQTFYINKLRFSENHNIESQELKSLNKSLKYNTVHNGLIVSPFGTFTRKVNGVSFSLWMSLGKQLNGLSFNLLWNY